jgi:hypothetical protein
MSVAERLLAARGVAGLFEVARGHEVGEQIGGLFRCHVPLLDTLLLHRGPHIGRVIPHQAGHHRGGVIAIHAARQIRRQGAALALQAVTLNTLFALEQLFAALGVAGDDARP